MSKADAEILTSAILKSAALSPVREFAFAPGRRWRFDFAFPLERIAVEIEGVTKWGGARKIGRHQTPKGLAADCEKYNAAVLLGWRVLRYTQDQIGDQIARDVLALMEGKP